jgi:hypothetical protein
LDSSGRWEKVVMADSRFDAGYRFRVATLLGMIVLTAIGAGAQEERDCLYYTSIAGWAQIPFCINATAVPQARGFEPRTSCM